MSFSIHCPMTYNSSRGLRNRRAYACRFPGIVLAWGRQNRGREHSLNPVNPSAAFTFLSCLIFSSYLQRRCQTIKSFNQFALACFLDDKCIVALAFTHPTYSLFTCSEQLVPRKVCGNELSSCENEQLQCIEAHRSRLLREHF